jgi:hypothetical protein
MIKAALLIGISLAVSAPAYAQRYDYGDRGPGWEWRREHVWREREREREREQHHRTWCYYHPRECR